MVPKEQNASCRVGVHSRAADYPGEQDAGSWRGEIPTLWLARLEHKDGFARPLVEKVPGICLLKESLAGSLGVGRETSSFSIRQHVWLASSDSTISQPFE